MKYHFKIHREGKGFWSQCVELEGISTQGETKEELQKNMHEALNLFLDEPADSKVIFSLPRTNLKGPSIAVVEVEPQIAFAFYLRRIRLKRGMTQKDVAKLMGYKNLYSYQRLEKAKTANPELSTIVKIKRLFPELDLEDILVA
jgi:antitoxin HicB